MFIHKGAFGTKTSCANFLFVFCSLAIAFFEPRDYRVVFVIQQKPEAIASGSVKFWLRQSKVMLRIVMLLPMESSQRETCKQSEGGCTLSRDDIRLRRLHTRYARSHTTVKRRPSDRARCWADRSFAFRAYPSASPAFSRRFSVCLSVCAVGKVG